MTCNISETERDKLTTQKLYLLVKNQKEWFYFLKFAKTLGYDNIYNHSGNSTTYYMLTPGVNIILCTSKSTSISPKHLDGEVLTLNDIEKYFILSLKDKIYKELEL